MKKLILLLLFGITFTSIAEAQSIQTDSLSLQEAIKLGLRNRYDIKADHYNISLAKNSINKRKKAWIPDIHAEGNIKYTTQIQPTYVPKGFGGFTGAGLLAFGARSATTFGLSLNQTLFKPSIHTNVKIARAKMHLQKERFEESKIDIKNAIATAYLNILLKKLQYQIAVKEENRHKKYYQLAKGEYHHKALIKNKYLQAKLDYKNAGMKTKITWQNFRLAKDYLKYQIRFPMGAALVLSDSIGNISFDELRIPEEAALKNRTEIKQLKWQQQVNLFQIKKVRQNALPTVSLVGYYAQMYQNQNFHYDESKWWAPHSYVGLTISVPITRNFSNKNSIRKYKLKKQQLGLNLKQKKSDIRYQIQKARADLKNAKSNMQSAKKNYRLSKIIYANQQKQFAIGVFRYSNLLDTEKSLNKAESNYIREVYNYLMAEIAYQKAVGEL